MKLLRRHLRRLSGNGAPFKPEAGLEDTYRYLFTRDLATLGEHDSFYPTGGAANYSMLYLIQRIAADLHPVSVLDIGAGQSTILWNLLARHGLVANVVTVEHDPSWAAMIGGQVDHDIVVSSLRSVRIGPVQTNSYDWPAVLARGPFDVVVCDGPNGSTHFSRYGILSVLNETTPADFTLVLDDAERVGEQDTIGAIHDRFHQLGRDYSTGILRAAKTQAIFATGTHAAICHI